MHALLAGCLRATIGTAHENDAFLAALAASLREAQ
jgi:histidinol-phosphate/aromatic aminotransferase/cobyric acid decarboxylase-like protein